MVGSRPDNDWTDRSVALTERTLVPLATDLLATLRRCLARRALVAWVGTDRIAALAEVAFPEALTPASVPLALFIAGRELPVDRVRGQLPLDELIARELVAVNGDRVRARVAIIPLGPSLLVCDRRDARIEPELVCWPDDSSHHLASSVPLGRVARWLDLGCGSAFAQLARPELADALVGLDANPRAIGYARLGAELSGIHRFTAIHGDVGDAREPAALITCNAPLPDGSGVAMWRRAPAGFFPRMFAAVRACLAPGGLAVIHAARGAIPGDLPGERVIVTYAPDFGVLWWRPHAPDRAVVVHRPLTVERPHLDTRDRDDALASASC